MQNEYWSNELNDIFSFNNFLKEINNSKVFDSVKYEFSQDMDDLEKFLTQNNISYFDFYTSIISLYLSRSSNSEGVIFSYSNLNPNDTFFKIKYDVKSSILEFILSVKNVMKNALDNSMENLKEYVGELYPDYCDYIFNYSIVNAKNDSNSNTDSSINFTLSKEFIEVEYDSNTFNRIEIDFMLENIESLIDVCLKDVNQTCCDVDIVCDRQLQLINEFSKNNDFEIDEKLLPDIIAETAKKYPKNFAINDEINRITYKELDELINSVSYLLQNEYDVCKSDKIILYLSRSYNVPLLTICLMKLGAVTIPVDDTYPESYIQAIIANSSPKYIIQESDYVFDNVESIPLYRLKNTETGKCIDVGVDLDDTALIMYTSGSTGVPKGVELTQRNIININYNYINYFNIEEGGTGNFMCLAKFTFVPSLPIYMALMNGFEAFIIRETSQKTIPRIVKYLMDYHCYILTSTQELGLYLYNNFDLNLDNLVLAGSSLTKANIRKDSSTELINGYGCTETSGLVIINKLNYDFSNYSVIGKHLGNSKVYILDENKKHLPIGSVGEIVISGPCVSKQYFNNPEQTDKAYGKFNNEKVYFTNDLGYFNNDGDVVYLGRKDNQINLNGFRIEPEGIESSISEYGNINKVKVTVREVNHQNHLIAYYSSNDNIDKNNLKKYLKHHLPNYMVPSFYMQIKDFPLNQNGKIDVENLPHIEFNEVEFVLPHDEYEEIIVNSFKKFFNKNKISIYDDFIQLGGTSITAMKILSELNEFNLTINDLITLRTPEKIAKHMKNHALPNFDWEKYSLNDACPLNESQLNVYLDIQRYEKNENYNIPITITIDKSYSINDIKKALSKIFNVHPILKTHIEIIEGKPYLKSENMPKIEYLKEHDENMINKFMMDPFDLNESLSRFLLVENEDNFVLFAVFHHLIFDGFSSIVFRKHLFDLLNGEILNTDVEFIKSSIYDEEIIKNPKYKEAEIFYETMLYEVDEVSPLLSSVKNNKAGFYYFDLSINENNIKNFLKSNNITENILFISAFAYTLSRFTGDSQALFNILDNGRDILNNYESIGMFVNTLPLLVDCFDKEITSFISEVKELLLEELSYNFYPFRVLANKYNLNSSILFQYHLDIDNDETEQPYNVSDLEFNVFKNNNGYSLKVIYSDEYSSEIIKKFVESYNMILIQILCVDKLSEINYISNDDIKLLNRYNKTEHLLDYKDILDAFNNNLSKYSDNTLVGFKNRNYTHGEGAFIANEISNMLYSLGIVKQDYVALFVPRSEWFLLTSLGVLTCGAIYVPIETTYPDERILLMLSDTQSKVVIVTDKTQQHIKNLIDKNKLNIKILNVSKITKKTIKSINHLNYETIDTNDIACVLYTSGTTGVPKGVLVTRKALNNFVSWYVDETNFTSDDVYGMHCSYVFDIHTAALFAPVISGGSLCVVPEDVRLDLKALNDFYVENSCTHTYITSQVGKLFAESGMETTIKLLCFGGMKLGELNAPDSIGPFESYGPSENLAISTSIFANKRIHHSSIGHFISNVKGYVLDDEHRRVPLGAVGELYLAGHQLTPGYLNCVEENDNAFFDNVFDDEKGYERIYKTGDMVRFLPDGSLGIVGRRDSQVKIRGNRVELGEIESAIRSIDDVEDVTVQTVRNNDNNEL
ncbi:AMP-binding protein, partial [uncultured Methanobrevibacter sp.]|uniref:AMP-binding protein n=1 Tax=uncultured Methanobrevibacter sp. TaxID=253161 RepID=UPI0025FAA006